MTLLNNEHGFKYDEYGDSITVRRTIKQPSGGGYALLDQNGEVRLRVAVDTYVPTWTYQYLSYVPVRCLFSCAVRHVRFGAVIVSGTPFAFCLSTLLVVR